MFDGFDDLSLKILAAQRPPKPRLGALRELGAGELLSAAFRRGWAANGVHNLKFQAISIGRPPAGR